MKEKYINQARKDNRDRHWSRYFYDEAKAEGYKFAVRQHIPNFVDVKPSFHKLNDKEEIWELPFIKKWQDSFIFDEKYLPKDHAEAFNKWEIKDYTSDGEQLLIAHLNNGSYWVIGYLMDLEKFNKIV